MASCKCKRFGAYPDKDFVIIYIEGFFVTNDRIVAIIILHYIRLKLNDAKRSYNTTVLWATRNASKDVGNGNGY